MARGAGAPEAFGASGDESTSSGASAAAEAPKQGALGHLSADEELQQAVCSALIETKELDTSEIEVRAANARVVLTGRVASDGAQRLAIRIAEAHAGRGAVDGDELHVRGEL
jgi:osmotically-inducible protein OsmY